MSVKCSVKERGYNYSLYSAILPYLIIGILIGALFLGGTYIAEYAVRASGTQMAQAALKEITSVLYRETTNYSKICDLLSDNINVLEFADVPADAGEELAMDSVLLQKELQNVIVVSDAAIEEIAIYYPENDSVITDRETYLGRENVSRWFTASSNGLLSEGMLKGIPVYNSWNPFYDGQRGWLVRLLYEREKTYAYIIVHFDLSKLIPLTEEEGLVFAGDMSPAEPAGLVYSNLQNDTDDPAEIMMEAIGKGSFRFKKKEYVLSRYVYSLMRLHVVVGISPDRFTREMVSFRTAIFCIGAVCIMGLALLLAMLYRNVLVPIRSLAETAETLGGKVSIRHIVANAKARQTALKNQNKAMIAERDSLVSLGVGELMRNLYSAEGGMTRDLSKRCLSLSGLGCGCRYCMIGIYHMKVEQSMFQEAGEGISRYVLLKNVLTDILLQDRIGIVAQMDSYDIVFFECARESEEEIEEKRRQLCDIYKKRMGITLAVTDPVIGYGADGLKDAVDQVVKELSYFNFWKSEKVSDPEDGTGKMTFYLKAIRKLLNRMDERDYTGAHECFMQILDENLPTNVGHLQIAKYRMYTLLEIIAASCFLYSESENDIDIDRKLERLYQIDNIEDFRSETEQIFGELISFREEEGYDNSTVRKIERVRQYVSGHYAENTMNNTSIAEYFHMNSSYLSREFKHVTGQNLLNYIQICRVDAAKKMLRTMSVQEVAVRVGFWDTQGLVRAFKKHEGITPGEYKKILEKEE